MVQKQLTFHHKTHYGGANIKNQQKIPVFTFLYIVNRTELYIYTNLPKWRIIIL